MSKIFYCYSKNLCHYLKMKGIDYLKKYQHKNGTYYYTFTRNKQLNDALTEWERYKRLFPIK